MDETGCDDDTDRAEAQERAALIDALSRDAGLLERFEVVIVGESDCTFGGPILGLLCRRSHGSGRPEPLLTIPMVLGSGPRVSVACAPDTARAGPLEKLIAGATQEGMTLACFAAHAVEHEIDEHR